MTNDLEQVTPGPEVALHSPEEFSPSGAAPFKAPQNMTFHEMQKLVHEGILKHHGFVK